jgi:chorismate dehydratase
MLQIGAVNYLNSKPLIEGLPEHSLNCELVLDYPSRLADDLAAHRLDVALIPSVECLRHSDYVVISDACVAARGPVLSVKLYSRVPPGQIRTLALDEGSRTSAALVRTILAHKYAVAPEVAPLPLDLTELDTDADAVLLIGDRAMLPRREKFHTVWDLGEEWQRWTGLPFVFAVWAARADLNGRTETLSAILSRARDRGLARLDQIAQREAPHLGITAALARSYLKHNLHFRLGAAERNGMRLFRQLAAEAGLIPGESDVVFSHSIHS